MNTTIDEAQDRTQADRALKAKHRAMWASGDYPAVATEVISRLGHVVVEAAGITRGMKVLDIAAGSGNASIPAALTGADVVASDLTPELFDDGRRLAADAGVEIDWREADAEALPFPDAEFDAVVSCVGIMFAPHHQVSADEMMRVSRPGATIGLLSWTPDGFIGQMFATMKPYAPPPPPGAEPPPMWGNEAHVRALLGDRVTGVVARKESLTVDRFETPESFLEFFKLCYGPTISIYKAIAGDPAAVRDLDRALVDLAGRSSSDTGSMQWEYLLLTARVI